MIEDKKIITMLRKSWKKTFNSGVFIPSKIGFCTECSQEKLFNKSNIHVNENKEFEANLNPSKRQALDDFVYMFPFLKK